MSYDTFQGKQKSKVKTFMEELLNEKNGDIWYGFLSEGLSRTMLKQFEKYLSPDAVIIEDDTNYEWLKQYWEDIKNKKNSQPNEC